MRLRTFLIDLAALIPAMVGIIAMNFITLDATTNVSSQSAGVVLHLITWMNVLMALGTGLVGGLVLVRMLETDRLRHAYYVAAAILVLAAAIGLITIGGSGGFPAVFDDFVGFMVPVAVYCIGLTMFVVVGSSRQ